MPSPFPGMDPWLENPTDFRDIHDSMIAVLREEINALLPAGYFARGARRVWIDDEQIRIPDVGDYRPDNGHASPATVSWEATMADAGMIAVEAAISPEPEEERFLEIREGSTGQLVTAIEVLSISNKTLGSNGRRSYVQKQAEYVAGRINLLEIDLLRTGLHTTMVPESILRGLQPDLDYHVCVTVPGHFHPYFVAPVRLDQPLPKIVVPLKEDQLPITLSLQSIFNRVYDTGRYHVSVNYQSAPQPPLTPAQMEWAQKLIQQRTINKQSI